MFYIVFVILLVAMNLTKYDNKIPLLIGASLMIGLIIFRYGYGADYFAYEHMYYRIQLGSFNNILRYYADIGIGFKLLIALFRTFNLPYHVFLVFVNSVTLFFILKWIDDNSPNKAMSVLLFYSMFFFVWTFSALRQGLVLSLALYYLFNPKNQLEFKKQIYLILLLTFIHPSSIILLLYLLLDNISWDMKKHVLFLAFSILITLIPLHTILPKMQKFPLVNLINNSYFNEATKFYDFPGLIRLVFFTFILFFYYRVDYKKREEYFDRFLYGVSLYFVFKFSEITASRLTIYSFIIFILLVPIICQNYEFKNTRTAFIVLVALFSSVYFYKEINTLAYQSAHIPSLSGRYTQFENIFNKNINHFGTDYSYELYLTQITEDKLNEITKPQTVSYDEKDTYVIVKDKKAYIIINQDGNRLEDYSFKSKPTLYKDIIVTNYYKKGFYFSDKELFDLSDKQRTQKELEKATLENRNEGFFSDIKEERVKSSFNDIPNELKDLYINEELFKQIIINKVLDDKPYYVMRIDYNKKRTFLYLDENKNLMYGIPFENARPFENKEILSLQTQSGKVYINKEGKIIWWEK